MLVATNVVSGIIFRILICIIIFLIGIKFFSFLNMVTVRMIREERKEICEGTGDYYLGKKTMRETLVKCLGGLLAIGIVAYYGIGLASLSLFLISAVLTVIAIIDMDTQTIPPVLNLILGGLGLLSILTFPGPSVMERIIGFFSISVPMFLIVLLIPGGFGGGDIKMMSASGIFLGWKGNIAAFFIGLLIGGAYGAWLMVSKKKGRKEHFAFGPCLSIGIFVSAFGGIGTYIVEQYLSMLQTIIAG